MNKRELASTQDLMKKTATGGIDKKTVKILSEVSLQQKLEIPIHKTAQHPPGFLF